MGVIDRLVTQTVLWIVYTTLPFLDGSLLFNPSFRSFDYPAKCDLSLDCKLIAFTICSYVAFYSWYYVGVVLIVSESFRRRHDILREDRVTVTRLLLGGLFAAFCSTGLAFISGHRIQRLFKMDFSFKFTPLKWYFRLSWILVLGNRKLLAQSMIFAFKNRRSGQLLLLIATVLIGILGSSIARKFLAIIPLVVGFILTFPDFDLEPSEKFKLRFTRFATHNMDEKSILKLLDSKHCKMFCCNEMTFSLAKLDSPTFSCFVKREDRQDCDAVVNPRYEIGLGIVTTTSNEDQIEVVVSTRCGKKTLPMRNTPLSRYNLDKSAGFWRDNPSLGILNNDAVKTHCISTEEWIRFCGSEDLLFVVVGHDGDV